MSSYIDLHMHTKYSDDGQFEPAKLVDMCKEAGVKIMAIADHNTVNAIPEAIKQAQKNGMKYIPAIEIDCTYKDVNLHVLGYGIDYLDPVFNQIGKDIEDQEIATSLKKIELTNALGFDVTKDMLDTVSSNGVYTGEMFAEVLLKDERYLDHELLKPYREGEDRGDNPYVNFYWDYYSQGKPCYVEIQYLSLQETIQIINEHGGIAVLAHPGNNLKGKFELFDEMVKEGIQGVECFSSYHSEEVNKYFYEKAKEYNLLYTCGSDFHGKTKPSIFLGFNGCKHPEEVETLLKKYELI